MIKEFNDQKTLLTRHFSEQYPRKRNPEIKLQEVLEVLATFWQERAGNLWDHRSIATTAIRYGLALTDSEIHKVIRRLTPIVEMGAVLTDAMVVETITETFALRPITLEPTTQWFWECNCPPYRNVHDADDHHCTRCNTARSGEARSYHVYWTHFHHFNRALNSLAARKYDYYPRSILKVAPALSSSQACFLVEQGLILPADTQEFVTDHRRAEVTIASDRFYDFVYELAQSDDISYHVDQHQASEWEILVAADSAASQVEEPEWWDLRWESLLIGMIKERNQAVEPVTATKF